VKVGTHIGDIEIEKGIRNQNK